MDRNRWLTYLVIGSLGIIGVGVFVWKGGFDAGPKVEIVQNALPDKVKGVATVWVDIEGQVKSPGVYQLTNGDRVDKVLQLAGGLTKQADGEWVDKNINKAAKLTDGLKIYVPSKNINTKSEFLNPKQGTININTASQSELESLAGIGPVTAGKIIASRPYSKTEELTEKKIVSAKVYDQIKDLISVW